MATKEDDVRLPFSTLDPVVGDIISLYWEPETLQSMGQTMNLLATEVLNFHYDLANADPHSIIATSPWADRTDSSYEFHPVACDVD